ncbi:prepilin-type N-terminal cleavage/methylation domain-containing protein [Bacillus sp. NEB1478]|uniref:type II secretion system protein n=1 Tax=Bacillus sp. NEB1478 TaxID=3073816 RepID=UPI002873C250|nr:prepilin-type N-terminal cleavage/methylation domain-containing protein [Bacillus sp. NEB1478]WNB92733.1 prepilin-type N-terminal cleavage/methylation domain-containing protein [Bacillus sp. NEB1478]
MLALLKKHLKNEKGLTLIELLVVIVILGIIAGIAVVSIGGIMENSKKDAHVANAQQMVNAAKMYVTSNPNFTNPSDLTLKTMNTEDLLETVKDPDGGSYDVDKSKVVISKASGSNTFTYTVTLIGSKKSITSVSGTELARSKVEDNKVEE